MGLLNYKDFVSYEKNKVLSEKQDFISFMAVNEGGAYGHLSHPFEDFDLSMDDLDKMITSTVNGSFGPDNFVQEKCVAGDNIVTLEQRGEITMKELIDNRYEDCVKTEDSNGVITFEMILDWFNNGESDDWLEIETEDGQIVTVTPNHRVFANGVDVKAEELIIGDSLKVI